MNTFKALISNPIDPMFIAEFPTGEQFQVGEIFFHELAQDYLWRITDIQVANDDNYLLDIEITADIKSDCANCHLCTPMTCDFSCQ